MEKKKEMQKIKKTRRTALMAEENLKEISKMM